MTRYFKQVFNDFITCVGENIGGIEISKGEYDKIIEILNNKPSSLIGFEYNLTTDFEWKLIETTELKTIQNEITE